MGGLMLCGKIAKKPYITKESGIKLFSIEECCYYLYNYIYLIDRDFFSMEFVEFVENQLDLKSLGQKLRYDIDHKCSMADMALNVLDASNYYSDYEKKNIEKLLRALESKSKIERLKVRADILFEKKMYISAIEAYKEIMNNKEEKPDDSLLPELWNNIGVIYARMMKFNEAVTCFKMACDLKKDENYRDNLVCAAIFSKDEDLLKDVAFQYQVSDEDMELYFKGIEEAKKELTKDKEYEEIKKQLMFDGNVSAYKEQVNNVVDNWKKQYREMNR